jgi:hypothetical protein
MSQILSTTVAGLLIACAGHAQTMDAPDAPVPVEPENEAWSIGLSAYTYIVPDDREYVQPTITLDRGWLHLEARYNYENLDTGSLWFGYNFSGGDELAWEFTPMLGGVFGDTQGVAPGYKGSLGWWKLEFYTEGEYVFDTEDSSESFYYSWSEFTVAPWDWLRVGLAGQRTRLYDADREYQGGFLVGVSLGRFDVAGYVFNPDESRPTWVVALSLTF